MGHEAVLSIKQLVRRKESRDRVYRVLVELV